MPERSAEFVDCTCGHAIASHDAEGCFPTCGCSRPGPAQAADDTTSSVERDGGPAICEVLMHEVLLPDFQAWLTARGLVLHRAPFLDEDPNLPVYSVAPSAERMRLPSGKPLSGGPS